MRWLAIDAPITPVPTHPTRVTPGRTSAMAVVIGTTRLRARGRGRARVGQRATRAQSMREVCRVPVECGLHSLFYCLHAGGLLGGAHSYSSRAVDACAAVWGGGRSNRPSRAGKRHDRGGPAGDYTTVPPGGAPQHHTRRRKHCVGGCQSGTNTASVLSPGATGGWEDAVVKPPPRVPQTQGSSKIEVAAGWASPSPLAACAALVQATWCLRCASPPPSSSSAGVQRWCRQRLDQCTWPTQKAPLVCVP
jgi:hypothetical protein